ncbi:MAG: ATP-binding protein [Acidobacteriota bacterium]
MSSPPLYQAALLAFGLVCLVYLSRRLMKRSAAADWLLSWSCFFVSLVFDLVDSEYVFSPLPQMLVVLHVCLVYTTSRSLAGREFGLQLFPVAGAAALLRGAFWLAGWNTASTVFLVALAVLLFAGSAKLLLDGAGRGGLPFRETRFLAVAFGAYALSFLPLLVLEDPRNQGGLAVVIWLMLGLVVCAGQLALVLITGRQDEQLLLESNGRLASLLESSSDFVAWADAGGLLRYGNRALRELTGDEDLPESDVESGVLRPRLRIEEVFTAEEGERLRESVLPIVEAGGLWEGDTVIRSHQGREVPVSAVVIGERGPDGRTVALGFLMRSLSSRIAAERDLRNRYEAERFVARLAADILAYPLPESEKAIEHALRTIHDRFGAHRSALFVGPDEASGVEVLFEVGGASTPRSFEAAPKTLELLRRGTTLHARGVGEDISAELPKIGVSSPSAALVPLAQDGELMGAWIIEFGDVGRSEAADEVLESLSELMACAVSRRRAWTLLKERDDELRHTQRLEAIGQLAGGIAHDFNNSLTVISGYIEELQGSEITEGQRESLEQVRIASDRAATLTSQLLAFSRNQELIPRVFDLNERIRELESMLRRVVSEHVHIHTELDEREPALICADPVQIDQVVTNLVINARDALAEGGRVRISTEVGSTNVWLLVDDDGQGMSEETRRRAFEPFYTTKGAGMGTGLGLSTVYGVIKQSGGRVSIDSALGSGTTVTISLPLVGASTAEAKGSAQDAEAQLPEKSEELPPSPAEQRTILLVEDELLVRRLTKRTLEQAGYHVLTASDGQEALETMAEAQVDFVLSDVVMPNMSGPEFVRVLRQSDRKTPVLFMSGYPNHPSQALSLPEGAVLIEKPFTSSALLGRIAELLDGSAWAVQTGAHNLLAFRKRS